MYPGEYWCPNWQLLINDWCTHSRAAQELIMLSNLPRDAEFTEKLTPHEVIQSLMVATASSTTFVPEMARQYNDMLEEQDSGKLQNKISKLEK